MIGYNTKTKTLLTKDDNLDVKALGRGDSETVTKHPDVSHRPLGRPTLSSRFPCTPRPFRPLSALSIMRGLSPWSLQLVPLYLVWDILFLNGEPLHEKPLTERRALLLKHVRSVEGRLMVVDIEVGPVAALRRGF
jgi:hypothetical protein